MELGYTSLALCSMFATNKGIAGQGLVGLGTDEQKARRLDAMAGGGVVASFALTQPGHQRFIANAPTVELFVAFARIRRAGNARPGITIFLSFRGYRGYRGRSQRHLPRQDREPL